MTKAGTLTRADISEAIHDEVGLSRADCANLVETILDHVGTALTDQGQVKISGFGTFLVRGKPARVGRNPKTGIEVPIEPRKVLTFRASQKMRDRIIAGDQS